MHLSLNEHMQIEDRSDHEPDPYMMGIGRLDMGLSPAEPLVVLYFCSLWRCFAEQPPERNRSNQFLPRMRLASQYNED